MIQEFMFGVVVGMILETICIVVTTLKIKTKERKEQYETGKRKSNNSTGLH